MGAITAGCAASYRSSAGGAMSPDGFGEGVGRSVVFSDEGGVLSRTGLGVPGTGLGVVGAVGSVEVGETRTETVKDGDYWVKQTTVEGSVDGDRLQRNTQPGMDLIDYADKGELSTTGGGIAANLEIASRSLGGDTSGAQFDMGYAFRKYQRGESVMFGVRGYVGVGYGKFTMHDRVLEQVDRGPPMRGTGEYEFLGLPARVGVFLVNRPRMESAKDIAKILGTETFARWNINSSGAQRFGVGQRLQLSVGFVEVDMMMSSFSADDRSYGVAFGLGI